MTKQLWELRSGEGGWIAAGQIYRSGTGKYFVRHNAVLASNREGINQIFIWRAMDGYHGNYYEEWNFNRVDSLLPDNVIPLESFDPINEEIF